MFNWIAERKHKKEIRSIEREKELNQAKCAHEYKYCGSYSKESYTGIDIDFSDYHEATCIKCGKTEGSYTYDKLKTQCKF